MKIDARALCKVKINSKLTNPFMVTHGQQMLEIREAHSTKILFFAFLMFFSLDSSFLDLQNLSNQVLIGRVNKNVYNLSNLNPF